MITQQQYFEICSQMLGLRVNIDTVPANMNAASYAMCITTDPKDSMKGEPAGWGDLLIGTLTHILEFDNAVGRYLAIVARSSSTNYEYAGCFPKCSTRPTVILASMPIVANTTVDEMKDWVILNLP